MTSYVQRFGGAVSDVRCADGKTLAKFLTPIDAFFENVTVNDPDPAKRTARLSMLEKVRDAVQRVADFSKIEG